MCLCLTPNRKCTEDAETQNADRSHTDMKLLVNRGLTKRQNPQMCGKLVNWGGAERAEGAMLSANKHNMLGPRQMSPAQC